MCGIDETLINKVIRSTTFVPEYKNLGLDKKFLNTVNHDALIFWKGGVEISSGGCRLWWNRLVNKNQAGGRLLFEMSDHLSPWSFSYQIDKFTYSNQWTRGRDWFVDIVTVLLTAHFAV